MPEGDTIYRAARTLQSAIEGREARQADASRRYTSGPQALDLPRLLQRVAEVESRGKHLLMRLEDGHVLHSHMGMTGSWHLYQHGEAWRKPAKRAALTWTFPHLVAVCFTPQLLELLSPVDYRRHPYLHRLGPDLLGASWNEDEALARLHVHDPTPIGEAVMNQTILAGIGNVYKSEVLFLQRMNPFAAVAEFDDELLRQFFRKARRLMRRNLDGRPRRTRFAGDAQRMWVYNREGDPCFQCGAAIQVRRQGDLGRTTYYCPPCQSATSVGSGAAGGG